MVTMPRRMASMRGAHDGPSYLYGSSISTSRLSDSPTASFVMSSSSEESVVGGAGGGGSGCCDSGAILCHGENFIHTDNDTCSQRSVLARRSSISFFCGRDTCRGVGFSILAAEGRRLGRGRLRQHDGSADRRSDGRPSRGHGWMGAPTACMGHRGAGREGRVEAGTRTRAPCLCCHKSMHPHTLPRQRRDAKDKHTPSARSIPD